MTIYALVSSIKVFEIWRHCKICISFQKFK